MTGTGCPFLDPRRNGPSQVLVVDGEPLLFDCGDNVSQQLMRAGIRPADVRQLFLTHLHTDHTHGLSQFVIGGWIQGRRELSVYGAGNVEGLMKALFEDAYRDDLDDRLRVRPGEGITDIRVRRVQAGPVHETATYRVTAAPAVHSLDAHAFRVDSEHGSVVLTGDTSYAADIVELARGAHTLVHECFLGERSLSGPLARLTELHSTPETAATVAREAGVRRLVLTHLMPGAEPEHIRERCGAEYDGEIVVAEDLQRFGVGG